MTVQEALNLRAQGEAALAEALRGLPEGRHRREGLRAARDAGIGPTELAHMMGVSRQRVYELLRQP
jgi:hypothetical protein